MQLHYTRAPLVEAVFEFAPAKKNVTEGILDRLDAHFSSTYKGARDRIHSIAMFAMQYKDGKATVAPTPQPTERRRLWSADGSRLVQYDSEMCIFNALPPYTHFKDYLPAIGELVTEYASQVGAVDTSFLGQRYVNVIQLPDAKAKASDYFAVYPNTRYVKGLNHPPFSLSIQTQTLSQQRGTVTLKLVYGGQEDGRPRYVLELYARTPNRPPISFAWEEMLNWQTEAHGAIEVAFNEALSQRGQEYLGRQEDEK